MLQKIYFMVFERYIPELKKYDSISFLHQPMASGQPLKIVQRHMAHPVLVSINEKNPRNLEYPGTWSLMSAGQLIDLEKSKLVITSRYRKSS